MTALETLPVALTSELFLGLPSRPCCMDALPLKIITIIIIKQLLLPYAVAVTASSALALKSDVRYYVRFNPLKDGARLHNM